VKAPDKPKVRGPIQFDSKKTSTESTSSPSDEQAKPGQTSATKTDSTASPEPAGSAESASNAAA
jgi:hypothetical protein